VLQKYNNTKRTRVQEVDPVELLPSDVVRLSRQGDVHAEVLFMAQKPKPGVKRLSKTEYVVLSTGEVKKYAPAEGKMRESLRRTFQELKALIRTNFSADDPHQKFITLTYAENMTDADRLYTDFKTFMMRLQYHYKAYPLDYIVVAEPQGRGAWHMHLMLKSLTPGLWIDKDDLTRIWRHGATEISQLKSDDVGNYYVAYFTSLSVEAKMLANGVANPDDGSKSYVKGGRLQYYPQGFRFYRCSRGIDRPVNEDIDYQEIIDDYGKPVRRRAYALVVGDDDGSGEDERVNFIQREAYRRMERVIANSDNNPKRPE